MLVSLPLVLVTAAEALLITSGQKTLLDHSNDRMWGVSCDGEYCLLFSAPEAGAGPIGYVVAVLTFRAHRRMQSTQAFQLRRPDLVPERWVQLACHGPPLSQYHSFLGTSCCSPSRCPYPWTRSWR
jgi:hypothetical protein